MVECMYVKSHTEGRKIFGVRASAETHRSQIVRGGGRLILEVNFHAIATRRRH